MKRITIEHYIASNNPDKANEVIRKYGEQSAISIPDLIKKVHKVMKKHSESVADFAKINTPYKDFIISFNQEEIKSNACGCSGFDGEQKSGCDGCGGTCGQNKSSVSGDEGKSKSEVAKTENTAVTNALEKQDKTEKYMPLAIVGTIGVIAITVALIAKK